MPPKSNNQKKKEAEAAGKPPKKTKQQENAGKSASQKKAEMQVRNWAKLQQNSGLEELFVLLFSGQESRWQGEEIWMVIHHCAGEMSEDANHPSVHSFGWLFNKWRIVFMALLSKIHVSCEDNWFHLALINFLTSQWIVSMLMWVDEKRILRSTINITGELSGAVWKSY